MAYWGKSLQYKLEPQEQIKIGYGLNTFNTPFDVKKQQIVSGKNITNTQFPALSVRPGLTVMYGTGTTAFTPNGAGVRNGVDSHFLDSTVWKYWNGTALANVATGLTNTTGKFIEFNTSAKRYTVMVNGTEKKAWDGTTVTDMTEAPATKYYAVDDRRLYALIGSVLKCSADGSVTDWTTIDDAATIPISSMVGTGTGLVAYNDIVIAFSDQTMHMLYGDDPFNFELSKPYQTGCISDKSIIVHKNGTLYFMDYYKFKSFTGGIPEDISQMVKGYLDNINYTYKAKIVSGQWGKYIYLSIPYGATATNNNFTLQYDTETGSWYPYSDTGYLEFYNIGQALFGLTTGGVVHKLNQGTADGSTAITWEAITGVWDGTPVKQRKTISNIWSIVDLPVGSTLAISYSTDIDSSTFTSLYTFTASASEQNTRIPIPTTALQRVPWYRLKFSGTGPCTIHVIEPHMRVEVVT